MSGIYGCIDFNKENIGTVTGLEKWNKAYGAHRSYKNGSYFLFGGWHDNLKRSREPRTVIESSRYIAVIDSVLYNADELIAKYRLKRDLTDEMIIFNIVTRFGLKDLKGVNGDFAGAIFDVEKNEVVLFRDHTGIRPLFYYYANNKLIFSSDLRGILSIKTVDATVNESKLYKLTCGYSQLSVSDTEFQNIFRLPPGSFVSFCADQMPKEKRFWRVSKKKYFCKSINFYEKRLRELVVDSLERRLAVIPGIVGAELSGGLDSSVISALINRLQRKGVFFSWAYSPEDVPFADFDERIRIKDLCEKENIECTFRKTEDSVERNQTIKEKMCDIGLVNPNKEGVAFAYAFPSYINSYTISAASHSLHQKGADVIFSGHGGDEGVSRRCNPYEMFHFGEYYHYLRFMWSKTHGEKGRLRKTFQNVKDNLAEGKEMKKRATFTDDISKQLLTENVVNRQKDKPQLARYFSFDPIEFMRHGGSCDRLDNTAFQGALNDVRYIFPYLDYRVVGFAVSIPRHYYLKGRQNRYIFRETFKDVLPESIYKYRAKEDTSFRSLSALTKENEQETLDQIVKIKEEIYKRLDKSLWKNYLNYEEIDKWMNREYSSREEAYEDGQIGAILGYCAQIQNMVEKARSIC